MKNIIDNKTTIIFDLDGTLIDSINMWNDIDFKLIKEISGIEESIENIVKNRDNCLSAYNNGDIYMNYADFLKANYLSKYSKEEINFMRNKISYKYLTEIICFKDGAKNFIKKLKEQGKTIVLATISSKWVLDLYNNENKNFNKNFYNMFDYILTKENVKYKKPNPEVYLKVLEVVGEAKENCLIFEDSLNGIKAATKSGIDTICIYEPHADCDREEINNLVIDTIYNYDEGIKKYIKENIRKRNK